MSSAYTIYLRGGKRGGTIPSSVLSPPAAAFPAGFIPLRLLSSIFRFDLLAYLPLQRQSTTAVLIIPDGNEICTRPLPYPRRRCNSDGIVFHFRRTCKIYYRLEGLVFHYDLLHLRCNERRDFAAHRVPSMLCIHIENSRPLAWNPGIH